MTTIKINSSCPQGGPQGAHQGILPNPPEDGIYGNQEEEEEKEEKVKQPSQESSPSQVIKAKGPEGIWYKINGPDEYLHAHDKYMIFHPCLGCYVTVGQYNEGSVPQITGQEIKFGFDIHLNYGPFFSG